MAKANSEFSRLYKHVRCNKHQKKGTKISVYRAIVLVALLSGLESGVSYRYHLRLLEQFHQCCPRTVLKKAKITSVEVMILNSLLRWAGHISRMGNHRLLRNILCNGLFVAFRNREAPKKQFNDHLKNPLGPVTTTNANVPD